MLAQSLLVFVSALAVASASPVRKRCESAQASSTVSATIAASPTILATPTLPTTGGSNELPSTNGTLKAIVVGHGIQNYTCAAAGANATSVGALAVLYDITDLYSSLSDDERTQLSADVLRTTDLPLNLAGDSDDQYAANVSDPFKADADLTVEGIDEPLKVLGYHYFDASLTPTFDLFNAGMLFKGGKLSSVKAPAGADPGLLNTGAVDWLQLGDKGASVGLAQVYRVVTAGGNGLSCDTAGQVFSVPYAAQYWYYD
ncbi:hypothetical protein SUNI508_10398 [Seiridium unicorne]|uniref:Malate dehydrogenase n=1 Tax=Seiridium unicorne TaxID=138068 RepID=A0ABR2UM38_9PEZI